MPTARDRRKQAAAKREASKRRQKETKRWQVVENVIAAIERARGSSGVEWIVTQKAKVPRLDRPEKRREVDVHVAVRVPGDRFMTLGFDVKNEKRPLDQIKIEQLCAKGRNLLLDRYHVVSTSGFAEDARAYAVAHNVHPLKLEQVDSLPFDPGFEIVTERATAAAVQFVYDGPDGPSVPNTLLGVSVVNNGTREELQKVVDRWANMATRQSNFPSLKDGDHFTLNVGKDVLATLSEISYRDKPIDLPDRLVLTCHLARTVARPSAHRFRSEDGVEVASYPVTVGGTAHQASITSMPDASGGRRIQLALDPALPRPRKV